jgi:hypothetical protein
MPAVPQGTPAIVVPFGCLLDEGRASSAIDQPIVDGDAGPRALCGADSLNLRGRVQRGPYGNAAIVGTVIPLPVISAQSRAVSKPSTMTPCWIRAPNVPPTNPPLILKLARSKRLEIRLSGSYWPQPQPPFTPTWPSDHEAVCFGHLGRARLFSTLHCAFHDGGPSNGPLLTFRRPATSGGGPETVGFVGLPAETLHGTRLP